MLSLISPVARMRLPKLTFIAPQPSCPFTAPQYAPKVSTEWSMKSWPVVGLVPKITVGMPIL